jgi:Domain of unknown function (DUF4439)
VTAADGPASAALQALLAAVNAAIYGYGVAGARLASADRQTALRSWTELQATRDSLAAMLTARGTQPAAARAAYQLPFPVHSARAAATLAGYLEDRLTAAYLGLVALDDLRLRSWGAQQAQACARRATAWLGRTSAFPGLGPAAAGATSAAVRGGEHVRDS